MIRAVVLDVGSVLEIVDDAVFPGPFEERHGLRPGSVEAVEMPGDPILGELTEAEVRSCWQRGLSLDDVAADELVADFWRWYTGTLDHRLRDWFAAQRPARLTGILSNSAPGAREAEARHGFEAITDDIVYSHEVGLTKPDPRIYELARTRLGVAAHEVVLLDDVVGHVEAARTAGWHGVVHVTTPASITELEALLAREG